MNWATHEQTLANIRLMKAQTPNQTPKEWAQTVCGLAVALEQEGHPDREKTMRTACQILGVSDEDREKAMQQARWAVGEARSR